MKLFKAIDAIKNSKIVQELSEEVKEGVKSAKSEIKQGLAELKEDIIKEVEEIKEDPFLREECCAICGQKAGVLTRHRLCDDTVLCFDCAYEIPSYVKPFLPDHYNLDDVKRLKKYLKHCKERLSREFIETASFGALRIDEEHGWVHIDEGDMATELFVEFKDIQWFNMDFTAKHVKEGLFDNKVFGHVDLELSVSNPYFEFDGPITGRVKAQSETITFSRSNYRHTTYSNPKELDIFVARFEAAMERFGNHSEHEQYQQQEEREYQESTYSQTNMGELQKARALFMFDDNESYTLDELKKRRNRLIRMYHPDISSDSDADTRFAQKINDAYEILKKSLE